MRIAFLYLDGCPNWKVADNRLAASLGALGRADIAVKRRQAETPDHTEELLLGFPTRRIEDTDPFATGQEQVGFAPGAYATLTGPGGSPETARLLDGLS